MNNEILDVQVESRTNSIIKVIGVGGGGGNAVNHMFKKGIHDVSFALCNTDNQALSESPIAVRVQLGEQTTHGLGAGNKPEVAMKAAEESIERIRELLSDGTRMVFITAGMGGGTGTGAAPVVAREAKNMGILTVGIVTIPFLFEGRNKIIQALNGVDAIAQNVDALLVINNERLRDIYRDLTVMNAFGKADDMLAVAAKSIAEIITIHGHINLDFADVQTTLKDGGVAIMSTGYGEGERRVELAIQDALTSPLLNNNDVFRAKKILINISFDSNHELVMEEMNAIHEFMEKFDRNIDVIWGAAVADGLDEKVKVTLLATGFTVNDVPSYREMQDQQDITQKISEDYIKEEQRRKDIEDQARINAAYGTDKAKQTYAKMPFIFTLDELNDETLIDMIEKTPVMKRDFNFNPRRNNAQS